jgi:hypothetical protein
MPISLLFIHQSVYKQQRYWWRKFLFPMVMEYILSFLLKINLRLLFITHSNYSTHHTHSELASNWLMDHYLMLLQFYFKAVQNGKASVPHIALQWHDLIYWDVKQMVFTCNFCCPLFWLDKQTLCTYLSNYYYLLVKRWLIKRTWEHWLYWPIYATCNFVCSNWQWSIN